MPREYLAVTNESLAMRIGRRNSISFEKQGASSCLQLPIEGPMRMLRVSPIPLPLVVGGSSRERFHPELTAADLRLQRPVSVWLVR